MWGNMGVRVSVWFLPFVYLTLSRNTTARAHSDKTAAMWVCVHHQYFMQTSKQTQIIYISLLHCNMKWADMESIFFFVLFFFVSWSEMFSLCAREKKNQLLEWMCRAAAPSTPWVSSSAFSTKLHREQSPVVYSLLFLLVSSSLIKMRGSDCGKRHCGLRDNMPEVSAL